MSDTAYKISVMQAWLNGKTIEWTTDNTKWDPLVVDNPCWNWLDLDYRVKKEPMVVYCNIYDSQGGYCYSSEDDAIQSFSPIAKGNHEPKCAVKFQEVIE